MSGESSVVEKPATDLAGKVAIVTGGASGIGRAVWRMLATRGARIAVVDVASLDCEDATTLRSVGRCWYHDVRDRDGWHWLVDDVVQSFGGLHVLVNAAGILRHGSVEGLSLSTWQAVLDINVAGTFWACQAAIPAMTKSGSGSIVNLSSVSGMRADAHLTAYDTSKGAVRSLTKDIAIYCTGRNLPVRCNSVHPGVVDTPMVDNFFALEQQSSRADWIAGQLISRVITADEVATLVAWLASDSSGFATGAEYLVDGGLTA